MGYFLLHLLAKFEMAGHISLPVGTVEEEVCRQVAEEIPSWDGAQIQGDGYTQRHKH